MSYWHTHVTNVSHSHDRKQEEESKSGDVTSPGSRDQDGDSGFGDDHVRDTMNPTSPSRITLHAEHTTLTPVHT